MDDAELRTFARELVALATRHGHDGLFVVLGSLLDGPRINWRDGKITIQHPTRQEMLDVPGGAAQVAGSRASSDLEHM